jgi:Anti-sigma-K factor rskA, C-terminal
MSGMQPDDAKLAKLLADESIWAEPSPDLEAHVVGAMEKAALVDSVVDLDTARRRRLNARAAAPWVVAVAAAAAAVVLAVRPWSGETPAFTAALAGTELAPGARGEADLTDTPSGFRIDLDLTGLPRTKPGFYYQAWLKGERGLVTIGTFHTGGKVTLWSGVDPARYPTLTVTLEPEDGDPASSGKKLLVGPVEQQ